MPKDTTIPAPSDAFINWDIFITWASPLINLSSKRPLTSEDIWDTPDDESVQAQSKLLTEAWEREIHRVEERNKRKNRNDQPSYLRALYDAYGPRIRLTIFAQFIFLVCQIVQPFIVGYLTAYIKTGEGGVSWGVGLAFIFFAVAILASLLLSFVFDRMRRLGSVIRGAIMMNVYNHSLRLTASSRFVNSVGQTTNLMAIDAEKLNLAVQFIHYLWHAPICFLTILVILIIEIGYASALCGFATLVILFPLQRKYAEEIGYIRRSMIQHTDNRVKLINEMLQSIRVIKLYAWEEPIEKRISSLRDVEMSTLHNYLDSSSKMREVLFLAQPLIALVIIVISTYAVNKPLTTVQLIKVLAFLNVTRLPFNLLGQALKTCKDALVSVQRLQEYFLLKTLPELKHNEMVAEPSISVENATFSWSDDEEYVEKTGVFSLKNLTFKSNKPNELIAVIGSVGSGKSSLISALLGEMTQVNKNGTSQLNGSVSYCTQTPWIQNLTLKDNVLFGSNLTNDELREQYYRAIDAAALVPDIKMLDNGDLTEIGERGINLSGGQKARVSLARAFFSRNRSQVYLLDDPFSAVDGNTGNLIFHKGVKEFLHDKLRVVVLNSHMHLLKHFDRIIVLENGSISMVGTYNELMSSDPQYFSRLTGLSSDAPTQDETSFTYKSYEEMRDEIISVTTPSEVVTKTSKDNEPIKEKKEKKHLMVQEKATESVSIDTAYIVYFTSSLKSVKNIINKAFYSKGNETDDLFSSSSKIYGIISIIVLLIIFFGSQFFRVIVDISITRFVEDGKDGPHFWRDVYFISFGILLVTLYIRSVCLNVFAVQSSKVLHATVLRKVLSAPITTFFDINAIGGILNRFSKDMETVDANIPEFMLQFMINWLQIVSVFAMCIWASYWFAIILVPLAVGFYHIYLHFSNVSRNIKMLESVSRSPVFSSLSETLTGLDTIRAYGDSKRFQSTHLARMSENHKLFYYLWICLSWMTVRLEISSSIILLAISLLSVLLRSSVSPISLGLALTYGLTLTALFQRCIQLTIDVSTYMTSTQRVIEYVNVPQETNVLPVNKNKEIHYKDINDEPLPDNWPRTGSIVFDNVWMQYRDNPPVLTGLNCSIKGGERVGVCGRTGAGKSSIMMTLFRIVDLMKGRILFDNVDISNIPLLTLRKHLAIIPQDPVLFTGSVRFQLDPFSQYSDAEVWKVLENVNLKEFVQDLPKKLNEPISEGGENLSQGQRQLLCIARALLRDCKVLVIDEGTSAVDPYTDELIQNVIKQQAQEKNITVLAIAHRLNTIINFDKVMVLGKGKLLEFGDPQVLKDDPNSIFHSMVNESH